MELLLKNGDYVPDGRGGLRGVEGAEEVLRRVVFRLQARRGAHPFLPRLGSQLYLLTREKPGIRLEVAKKYVAQALEEETQVRVKDVALGSDGQGKELLTVWMEWQGQELSAQVNI